MFQRAHQTVVQCFYSYRKNTEMSTPVFGVWSENCPHLSGFADRFPSNGPSKHPIRLTLCNCSQHRDHYHIPIWCPRRDSNPQHQEPESCVSSSWTTWAKLLNVWEIVSKNVRSKLVPMAGLEPASCWASDFESDEFTNFSTSANIFQFSKSSCTFMQHNWTTTYTRYCQCLFL